MTNSSNTLFTIYLTLIKELPTRDPQEVLVLAKAFTATWLTDERDSQLVIRAAAPAPNPDDHEAMRALTMFTGWANGHTMMNWRRLAESIGLKRRRMESARDRLIAAGRVVQRGRRFYVVGATGELSPAISAGGE
jgi:hypothetical protein